MQVRLPLHTISLGVQSIRDFCGVLDEDTSFAVACICEGVEMMSGTLNDAMSYTNIEEGVFIINCEPFDLSLLIVQLVRAFEVLSFTYIQAMQ